MSGCSLLELMLVLVIATATLTVTHRMKVRHASSPCQQEVERIVAVLKHTRQQAMSQGIRLHVCPTQDGMTCAGQWGPRLLLYGENTAPQCFSATKTGQLDFKAYPKHAKEVVFLANGQTDQQNGTWYYRTSSCQARITLSQTGVIQWVGH